MDPKPYISNNVTTFLWNEVRRHRLAVIDGNAGVSEPTLATALEAIQEAPSWESVFDWFGIECANDEDVEAYACLTGQFFNLAVVVGAYGGETTIMELFS